VIRERSWSGALGASLLLAACHSPPAAPDAAASAAPPTASAAAEPDRIEALLGAEHRRLAQAITSVDQQSRDVAVRRAGA